MLIGGTEPECEPLQWLDEPEQAHPSPTTGLYEARSRARHADSPG